MDNIGAAEEWLTQPDPNTAGLKYECPKCHMILQSMYRHDFVMCDCPNKAFVDGGSDYIRAGAVDEFPKLANIIGEENETI